MTLPLFIVDAFTAEAFGGNPAGVCLLDREQPDAWMQSVAREMNLSETAFLCRRGDTFCLRWFTPAVEVDLCGHATLASAHILWESNTLPPRQEAVFETKSGRLTCKLQPGGAPGERWIDMDFPAERCSPVGESSALMEALGHPILAGALQKNRMDYLVEVGDEQAVREMVPDLAAIARLPVRAVIVTAHTHDVRFDFVSRFFAPAVGVAEDPVTGSAHCALGPYWAERLGKQELRGFQASARGGIVRVRVHGERVTLSGQAVTVVRGEWSAPLSADTPFT